LKDDEMQPQILPLRCAQDGGISGEPRIAALFEGKGLVASS
jgi:hypothetical protein